MDGDTAFYRLAVKNRGADGLDLSRNARKNKRHENSFVDRCDLLTQAA